MLTLSLLGLLEAGEAWPGRERREVEGLLQHSDGEV